MALTRCVRYGVNAQCRRHDQQTGGTMRTWGLVVLLVLACVTPSAGQTPKDDQGLAIRQGRIKMGAGIVMVAAGAAMVPITAATSNAGTGGATVAAVGLMGA